MGEEHRALPVIIVEYNQHERTARYILDFLDQVRLSDIPMFIIIDNSPEESLGKIRRLLLKQDCGLEGWEPQGREKVPGDGLRGTLLYRGTYGGRPFFVLEAQTESNLGYGRGNNQGVRIARVLSACPYALLSNSDIRFETPLEMDKVLDRMRNEPAIAVAGVRVNGLDGMQQSPCRYVGFARRWIQIPLLWPFQRLFKRLARYETLDYHPTYPYRLLGAFMLIDIEKFTAAGMFDEAVFMYAEEMILAEKTLAKGYVTYCDCGQAILHEGGGSVKSAMADRTSVRLQFTSDIYFYMHYKGVSRLAVRVAKIVLPFYLLKRRLILPFFSK